MRANGKGRRSYSELSTFRTCARKWQHRYLSRYYPKETPAGMVLGSAFHSAIANYLINMSIDEACDAACLYIDKEAEYNPQLSEQFDEYKNDIVSLIQYHLPKVNPNNRYRVVFDSELFEGAWDKEDFKYRPLIEYKFEHPLFKGVIDAILFDEEVNEFVLIDWKLRANISSMDSVRIDSQLPFYVGIINLIGGRVTRAIQWQFKRKLPQKARLSKKVLKDGENASILSPTKITTLDYLISSLPDDWTGSVDDVRDKFSDHRNVRGDGYFQWKTEIPVTGSSLTNVYYNQYYTSQMIDAAEGMAENGVLLPGLMSSYECPRCEYKDICRLQLEGKDISHVLQRDFDIRM